MIPSFLSQLIEESRRSIGEMAQLAADNLDQGAKALGKKSAEGLGSVSLNEKKINELHSKISRAQFKILARQSPVAGDLRMVLSLGRVNDCLERIGDLTYSMSKDLEDYFEERPSELVVDIAKMADLVVSMMQMGLQCFFDKDPQKAAEVLLMDDTVNRWRSELLSLLKEAMKKDPDYVEGAFYLISVVRKFERIGDLLSCIANEVIFSVTGSSNRHQHEVSSGEPLANENLNSKIYQNLGDANGSIIEP